MFVTALLPVVVLLLIMPVGILGIVLFIVGLVKKKPAMWASGIAIGGVLGLLVFAVGAGMLMRYSVRRASTPMMAGRITVGRSMAVQPMPFKERTGLDLPPGTATFGRYSGSITSDKDGTTKFVMLHLSVPPDFDEFLAANFTKAKWQDVAQTFQAGRSRIATFLPSDIQLQAMSLYSLINQADSNSPSTVTTVVAHDAGTQRAWVVSVEKALPATQP